MMAYIAGPLFNEKEREFLDEINSICRAIGIDTYLPAQDGGLLCNDNADEIFKTDIRALNKASLVVASLNGVDVDSGTAFELGYGFAKGKKLFGLHTDSRVFTPSSEVNLMILKSCTICHSLQELDTIL
ncbi:MAG: nucleoside 2-deoxyribosyltransferase, partial [Candidatus Marinimicrobia bacterium]|nr:nucleoside 2-deoxyribosyltransferase [Candidatus Neomarinimicrobiota bacterium]